MKRRKHNDIAPVFMVEPLEERLQFVTASCFATFAGAGVPTGDGALTVAPNATVTIRVYVNVNYDLYGAQYNPTPTGTVSLEWFRTDNFGDAIGSPGTLIQQSQGVSYTDITVTLTKSSDPLVVVDQSGDYRIRADYSGDANLDSETSLPVAAGQDGNGVQPYQNSFIGVKFTASDSLVVTKQPTDTSAGESIAPVKVAIDNTSGGINTAAKGTVAVQIDSASTGTGTLTGKTSASFAHGVATFSNLIIDAPGQYELTFTDSVGDATTSAAFSETAKLVFTKQPTNGDIKAPILFTVSVENAKHKVLTAVNGDVTVSLNIIEGGDGAALTGDASVAIVSGAAVYTIADDDAIAAVGTYTLTASEIATGTNSITTAAVLAPADRTTDKFFQGLSEPFALDGFQLQIEKAPPAKNDSDAPIPFEIILKDKKRKVVTADDGNYVDVSDVTQVGESGGAQFNNLAPTVMLENGIAKFTTNLADALIIQAAGKFAFRVTEVSSVGATRDQDVRVTTTNDAITRPFRVVHLHLVFIEPPAFGQTINQPVPFKVAVEDDEDKIVTTEDANAIDIVESGLIGNSGTAGLVLRQAVPIVDGIADFTTGTDIEFTEAGTFVLEVGEADPANSTENNIMYVSYTAEGYTHPFRVSAT